MKILSLAALPYGLTPAQIDAVLAFGAEEALREHEALPADHFLKAAKGLVSIQFYDPETCQELLTLYRPYGAPFYPNELGGKHAYTRETGKPSGAEAGTLPPHQSHWKGVTRTNVPDGDIATGCTGLPEELDAEISGRMNVLLERFCAENARTS